MKACATTTHAVVGVLLWVGLSEGFAVGGLGPPPTPEEAVAFFVSALLDPEISIALCQGPGDPLEHEDFVLRDGRDLRGSTFGKIDQTQMAIRVVEAVKGEFDRLVVYPEPISRGRIYPAFRSTSFIPPPKTQWIVFFCPEGSFIEFSEWRTRPDGTLFKADGPGEPLPVLKLVSKEYGIIRYDGENHLGLDAKAFLSDLKKLVQHVEGKVVVQPDDLATDMAKEILSRLPAP